MTELVIRMVLSLCIVLGLLLLAARVAGKRYRAHAGSSVQVLQRQALSRGSTVTVVSVGTRVLVLGTTEQQVRVLAELSPDEIAAPDTAAHETPVGPITSAAAAPGRLYALPVAAGAPDFAQVLLEAQEVAPAPTATTTAARAAAPGRHSARHRATPSAAGAENGTVPGAARGPLAGSLLSPQTWRQALQAVSGRAS